MVEAPRDIAAGMHEAAHAAELAAGRAERISRRNAALLEQAMRSLEDSALLVDELAERAGRLGLSEAAATARANATRARRAASTRLVLSG